MNAFSPQLIRLPHFVTDQALTRILPLLPPPLFAGTFLAGAVRDFPSAKYSERNTYSERESGFEQK
jgi:hypothetical protein